MTKKLFLAYSLAVIIALLGTETSIAQSLSSSDMPPLKPIKKTVFDTAYTEIYYEYSFRRDSTKSKWTNGQTILLVGKKCLGFMDYYQWQFDKANDSLYYAKQSPMSLITNGLGLMQNAVYKYPLVIDKGTGRAIVQVQNINNYEYTEQMPVINWNLTDGDTLISNVPCKKAFCVYGGRKWNAWYAPTFHLKAGPYLFSGLPGLIFDIKDAKNNYHFTLNGLENLTIGTAIYLHADVKIIKTTRQNALRAVENEQRDIIKAFEMASPGIRFSEDMQKGSHSRPYNPIEIE